MTLTRRTVLRGGAAALGALGLPRFAIAEMALGGGTLTTVSDGHMVLPGSFVFEPMDKAALAPLLAQAGVSMDSLEPPCNLTLWRDGTNTVLFDAGAGPDFMPTTGKMLEGLEAAGVAPEEVSHLVITHAHPDHINGLLDDFEEPLFLNAEHLMGQAEWDFWYDPAAVDIIGEARAGFAIGARRRMEIIEGMTRLFADGEEVLPGIAAVASYGHTPGHMSFELRQGGTSALVLGDAIANDHIALMRPGWEAGNDQDPSEAAATRLRLLDRITAEQMAVVGYHFGGGGLGRIEAAGEGYRFAPEA